VPFNQAAPHDPVNRRISIIVMNKRTEDAVTKEAAGVNVASEAGVRHEIGRANAAI
jgi:chemotaxis protein MotB